MEKIPDAVFKDFEKIRLSGETNMMDLGAVIQVASKLNCFALLDYLGEGENKREIFKKYSKILDNYSNWKQSNDRK